MHTGSCFCNTIGFIIYISIVVVDSVDYMISVERNVIHRSIAYSVFCVSNHMVSDICLYEINICFKNYR